MRRPLLSITIPTYNRNEILLASVRRLVPQLTTDCELVILDNGSAVPVESELRELAAEWSDAAVRVVRHRANVGGNENILRCFEHATGEYVWLLGDDDPPRPDAVSTILRYIGDYPRARLFNMYAIAANHATRTRDEVAEGSLGYLDSCAFLGELMFISSLVFRLEPLLKNAYLAHHMQVTHAPQLILALLALRGGGQSVLASSQVVEHGAADTPAHQQASTISIALGLPILLQGPWTAPEAAALQRHIVSASRKWITAMGLLNQLVTQAGASDDLRQLSLRQYHTIRKNFFSRCALLSSERLIFLAGYPLVLFPRVGRRARNFAWQLVKKRSYDEGFARSSDRI